MLKHLSICAALVVLAGPVYAQKQEAVLQEIEVPGAGFDFILAAPAPGRGALPDLGNMPEALVKHLYGGKLVVVFDDARRMLDAADLLQKPICAFDVEGQGGSPRPVALYLVPKGRPIAPGEQVTRAQPAERSR